MKNRKLLSLIPPLAILSAAGYLIIQLYVTEAGNASVAVSSNDAKETSSVSQASAEYTQATSESQSFDLPTFVDMPMITMGDSSEKMTLHVSTKEVTTAEWQACVAAKGCSDIAIPPHSKPDHPMTQVSRYDVERYLTWFKQTSGLDVRLPTQLEWISFAADHLPTPSKKLFDDPRLAWAADYDMSAEPRSKVTQSSGSFGENTMGILDLEGNVWEWTQSICSDGSIWGLEDCGAGRIAMGEHVAVLSDFVRDPGSAGCGGGIPPPNVGFRLVYN